MFSFVFLCFLLFFQLAALRQNNSSSKKIVNNYNILVSINYGIF